MVTAYVQVDLLSIVQINSSYSSTGALWPADNKSAATCTRCNFSARQVKKLAFLSVTDIHTYIHRENAHRIRLRIYAVFASKMKERQRTMWAAPSTCCILMDLRDDLHQNIRLMPSIYVFFPISYRGQRRLSTEYRSFGCLSIPSSSIGGVLRSPSLTQINCIRIINDYSSHCFHYCTLRNVS